MSPIFSGAAAVKMHRRAGAIMHQALTVDRHIVRDDAGISILLGPADTKSRRPESFRVPPPRP